MNYLCGEQGISICLLDQTISMKSMHQIAPFQKRFRKKFSGEGLTEPPPHTPPPELVSGCALDSGFALSFHAVLGNRSRKFLDPPLVQLQ